MSSCMQHSSVQSDINDGNDPMSFFTSIPKTLASPKRFNKPWFTDSCKDAIEESNRTLEQVKCEENPQR